MKALYLKQFVFLIFTIYICQKNIANCENQEVVITDKLKENEHFSFYKTSEEIL